MNNKQQALARGVFQFAPIATARLACLALTLAVAMSGCAVIRLDPVITDAVEVERVDSPRALVTSVQVRDHNGRLKVSGRLKKRHRGRSPIPGHLHIEAHSQDGAMLGQVTTGYRQLSPKMGISKYSQVLDLRPDQVRTVRVIHHHRDDHDDAANERGQPTAVRSASGPSQPA